MSLDIDSTNSTIIVNTNKNVQNASIEFQYFHIHLSGDENLAKRLKELEIQLANSNAEARSLSEQLKASRQQSQQYCDIAESTEAQLRELTTQHEQTKRELQTSLEAAREEATNLAKRVKELESELVKAQSGLQETDADLREKLTAAETKLEELDEVKGELELIKSDLQSASQAAKEAEEKYAREMVLHSADLQVKNREIIKLLDATGQFLECNFAFFSEFWNI